MNTFKIITTLFLLTLSSYSFGQFGGLLKKPKKPSTKILNKKQPKVTTSSSNKATASSDKSTTNSNASASTVERYKDGSPKHNSDNPSPLSLAHRKAKENLKYAQSTTSYLEDRIKYLEKAKPSLDFLNEQESEKGQTYLKEFNETYNSLSTQYAADQNRIEEVAKHRANLEQYYKWVAMGRKITDENLAPNYKAYYKHRDAFKVAYPDEFAGDYNQKMATKVDGFFKVDVYKKVDNLDEDVAVIIRHMHKVNGEREQYILNADGYLKDFEKPIKSLNYYKENLLEDLTKTTALEAKINKEKGMLEEYINSGKFAANKALFQQEIIDARLLRKGMSDSKLEAFAKSKLPAEFGKILRVTVASTGWGVNKNYFDIPVSKGITVDFATKKEDGKCYYISASVMQTYEGGGNYGNWYFSDPWEKGEMNCNNVNK